MEWNDMRQEIGVNFGVYDNPHDLTPEMFTLMRFTEWVNPETRNLEWLIRKDGCMHCEDPGCLKACPAPGAIVQYSNGIVDFDPRELHRLRLLREGLPVQHSAHLKVDHKAYKCTLCSDRVAVGQARPAPKPARPGDRLRHQGRDDGACRGAHQGPEVARVRQGGPLRSARRRRHPRDVRSASRRSAATVRRTAEEPEDQPDGRAVEGGGQVCGFTAIAGFAAIGFVHHLLTGANRVSREDEESAKRLEEGSSDERLRRGAGR